jgi:hypothetical protein
LFTPAHWCLYPYLANFGIERSEVEDSSSSIRGYLFDQYVRACGFTPEGSWMMVVLPTGECEFTGLNENEPLSCCENRAEIAASVATPTVGEPPWAGSVAATASTGTSVVDASVTIQ